MPDEQTVKQTDGQIDRQRDGPTNRHKLIKPINKASCAQADRWIDRRTERRTNRQTDRQKGRQAYI